MKSPLLAFNIMQQKKAKLRRRADKLLQQLFVELNPKCFLCPKPTSCGHHYYPKSRCSALRYDFQNLINLCVGHHLHHHAGDPSVHNKINQIKGKAWLEELEAKKRNISVKTDIKYYENIIENLKKSEHLTD